MVARVRLRASCFAVAVLAFASTARAAEPDVSVSLTDCDAALTAEVRRIAAIELRATVIEEPRGVVSRAIVVCRGSVADLWVADAATSKVLTRTVSLADADPRARARLIALAVSELVLASWEELERPPLRVPPVEAPAPGVRETVKRTIEGPPSFVVDAVADARLFTSGTSFVFGGGARLEWLLPWSLALRVDTLFDAGLASRSLGDVHLEAFGGSLGIGRAIHTGWLMLTPWLSYRAGYGRLSGVVGSSGVIGYERQGFWGGPELGVEAVFVPSSPVHVSLALAGGYALSEIRGQVEGDRDVALGGAWLGVTLGVGAANAKR